MFAFRKLLVLLLLLGCGPSCALADWGDDQYTLAADHYRNGRWAQAISEFKTLIEKEPQHARSPIAHFFMGESQIQLQDFSSCIDHFSIFIDQTPKHPLKSRAIFRRAEAHYLVGNDSQAIEQLEAVLADPESKSYHEFSLVYLGEMHQRLTDAKNQNQAKLYFEKALSQYPDSTLVDRCRLGLAQVFQTAGQYQEADRFLKFLIDSGRPEIVDQAIVSRAGILVELESWQEALQLLDDQRIERLPFALQAKATYWRGRAELGLGKWPAAIDHLRKAYASLKNDPLAEAAAYDCAIAYWQAGQIDNAQQMLQQSIQRWPKGRWVAEARFLRIQAALETGDTTVVQNRIDEFANFHSGHVLWPRVLEAEGRAAFSRADYSQATASFKKLLSLPAESTADSDPAWQPNWYYMLAVSQIAKSDYLDALQAIEKCQSLLKQYPASELHGNCQFAKCTALLKLKRYPEALTAQDEWLEKFGDSNLRLEIQADRLSCLIATERWNDCAKEKSWIEPLMKQTDAGSISKRNYVAANCLQIAKEYFESGQTETATPWFQLAAQAPESTTKQKAESGLAWTAFRTADGQQRDKAFEVLMERYPDHELSANAALKQAENLMADGKPDQAKSILRSLADREGSWPNKHLALALLSKLTVVETSKASKRAAAKLLRDAIAECEKHQPDPSPLDSYLYDLAWLRMELNQSQEAISRFRQINLNFPNSRYWADATFRVAQNYFDQNKSRLAEETLQQILDRSKDDQAKELVTDSLIAHVYYLQAMVAVQQENWAEVKQRCQKLCSEYPDHSLRWNAEYWQAEAQYRSGEFLSAVVAMRSVTERTAGRLEPWVAMAHLRLAQSLGQRGQWDEALQTAENAKRRFVEFRQAFELDYLIGRALAQDARFDEARAAYQKVIDSPIGQNTETAAMAQWMIGETYFHQEQYSLAAQAYHRTETLYRFPQWQAAALLQAGKCYEHLSQESDAISVYRQLIRDYTGQPLAKQGQQRLDRLIQKQNLTATGNRNRSR